MAGPRAPIGTLSQHAATAAGLVRNMVPSVFTRTDSKRARKPEETVASESESDSESSSDSETSETGEDTRRDTKSWVDSMRAKKAASTPIKTETSPITSLKAKTASPAAKPGIKKPEPSDSSDNESESDSGSEDEDNKMDVDSKPDPKNIKEEGSDSEAESESSDEEMPDSKPTKKVSSASASEDGSASESESSDEESGPGASGAKVATKADAKQTAASEEESASESESEGEGEDEEPAAKPRTTAQSESDSESASESEDEPEPPRKPKEKVSAQSSKPAKPTPVKPSKQSDAVNGTAKSKEIVSESESSRDESESEGEDATEKQKGKTAIRAPPREIVSQGFTLRKAEADVDAAAVARAFKKAKAEGKQIWYFTTPKSVPIEVIQKHAIPLDKLHAGRAIFDHEGAEYTGHFEEPINHAIKVLIPGKDGSKYETMDQSVDRVFHITRVVLRGDDGESEPAPASTSSATVNGPRPQPKGLKARYQPFGVTGKAGADAADSDEDVEMAQAPPLLNGSADAKSGLSKKAAKKRKHGDVEKETPTHGEPASTPAKKPKKARVDSKPVETAHAKPVKQTPIAPPPVPPSSAKSAAPSEPVQPSPVKKSKGKDKSKKDSASAEKASGSKKPPKVTPVLPPAVPTAKSS